MALQKGSAFRSATGEGGGNMLDRLVCRVAALLAMTRFRHRERSAAIQRDIWREILVIVRGGGH